MAMVPPPGSVLDRKARRLQELFRGRFSTGEALAIIRDKNGDILAAVDFISRGVPDRIRRFIHDADHLLVTELQRDCIIVGAALRNGTVSTTVRQFGCHDCDTFWWRKVPARKEVSKCSRCLVRYEAIPRDHEWGLGIFECECGSNFRGFGQMGPEHLIPASPCFLCQRLCYPVRIEPPDPNYVSRTQRSKHMCNAGNCYRSNQFVAIYGHGQVNPHVLCCHPQTLGRRVHFPSRRHASTGSTVATFLTQDNYQKYTVNPGAVLDDVMEDDESQSD